MLCINKFQHSRLILVAKSETKKPKKCFCKHTAPQKTFLNWKQLFKIFLLSLLIVLLLNQFEIFHFDGFILFIFFVPYFHIPSFVRIKFLFNKKQTTLQIKLCQTNQNARKKNNTKNNNKEVQITRIKGFIIEYTKSTE